MNYPTTQSSLLERVQNGDEISWNEFYFRYAPVIRAAGSGFHFNDAECDDLVQLVMLKFFANAKTFVYRRGEVKFRTYFSRIVHNQAVDMIRRGATQKNLPGELSESTDPFNDLFMEEWRKAVFAEAKDELRRRVDEKTFLAFELYGLQNRDIGKVAAALELTPNQIYVAKNRCVKILRGIVARHNRNDGDLHLEI
ncbi:MAG: sigma-70 family RNA polymerase sigma factor [Lentisphaeria bacterium]|nr:sigma-70 family RNA polymerase sigma factor [Lentisphaeria bacterium]